MVNNQIIWTKVYKVNHVQGAFKLYVSSHNDLVFHSGFLHYSKQGKWTNREGVTIHFELEQFTANSELDVFVQCINWITENLDGKFQIFFVENNA